MDQGLTIDADVTGTTLVLGLDGELDWSTVPVLEEAVRRAPSDLERVVLDLARLRFLDSAGISAILGVRQELQRRGASLTLARPGARTAQVVEMMGLDAALDVTDADPDQLAPPP